MKKAILLGALSGAVIAFVWSCISWMVLPWYTSTFGSFKNPEVVAQVIRENAPEEGIYMLPNFCDDPEYCKRWEGEYRRGPLMFSAITPGGKNPNMTGNMVIHFITVFVASGLISVLLTMFRPNSTYRQRVAFSFVVGIIVAWLMVVPGWNWWNFSARFSFVEFFDVIITWTLAGLGIAKFAVVKATRKRK